MRWPWWWRQIRPSCASAEKRHVAIELNVIHEYAAVRPSSTGNMARAGERNIVLEVDQARFEALVAGARALGGACKDERVPVRWWTGLIALRTTRRLGEVVSNPKSAMHRPFPFHRAGLSSVVACRWPPPRLAQPSSPSAIPVARTVRSRRPPRRSGANGAAEDEIRITVGGQPNQRLKVSGQSLLLSGGGADGDGATQDGRSNSLIGYAVVNTNPGSNTVLQISGNLVALCRR